MTYDAATGTVIYPPSEVRHSVPRVDPGTPTCRWPITRFPTSA